MKLENAGQGLLTDRDDYFSAHHYINTQRTVKVGIYWPFYPNLGGNRKMSDKASSGSMGGRSGGGGGGSALGGMKGSTR